MGSCLLQGLCFSVANYFVLAVKTVAVSFVMKAFWLGNPSNDKKIACETNQ